MHQYIILLVFQAIIDQELWIKELRKELNSWIFPKKKTKCVCVWSKLDFFYIQFFHYFIVCNFVVVTNKNWIFFLYVKGCFMRKTKCLHLNLRKEKEKTNLWIKHYLWIDIDLNRLFHLPCITFFIFQKLSS